MSDETKKPEPGAISTYVEVPDAPIVYFDICAAQGIFNGAIQVELASRIMTPLPGGANVGFRFVTTGRLRCSPVAARTLQHALSAALKMLENAGASTTAGQGQGNKLN